MSVIRGELRRLNGRRVNRDQATNQGTTNQTKATHQPYNHLNHIVCRSHRRKFSLKTAPCLSSSLAATDSTNPTNLLDSLFNCVSDNNFTYCSSPEASQGGEGRLHSCDRLFIHITNSIAKFHLSTITLPSKHFHTKSTSSRVNFNFIDNFVTTKVIFSFHFQFFKTILHQTHSLFWSFSSKINLSFSIELFFLFISLEVY